MEQGLQSKVIQTTVYVRDKMKDFFSYIAAVGKPHIENGIHHLEPYVDKSKEFYQNHKEIILVIGAVTITYLIVRPKSKEEDKIKKKKQGTLKLPITQTKTFISDNSIQEFRQEPSTTIKVESSGREANKKKNVQRKLLEQIESSSPSQDQDKIFFAMYHNYQNA